MKATYHFETRQVHVGQEAADAATGARAVPIYATTAYEFPDAATAAARFSLQAEGNIYSRLTNPTNDVFERRMASLEGGAAAVAFASGAAAIDNAVRGLAQAGHHIVASANLYGGTYNLFAHTLAESGITSTFVKEKSAGAFEAAIRPETRLVYIESMGNPNCDLVDVAAIAEVAHRHGIPLVVDNTFATPYLFRPLEHGADIVVHSATKFIGGHGTVMGGVVIDGGCFDWGQNDKFSTLTLPCPGYHGLVFHESCAPVAYATRLRAVQLRDQGAALSPFHSFMLLQGVETLSLRVERHVQNALRVVEYLQAHPEVVRVNHPSLPGHPDHALYRRYFPQGGGSIFTLELKGDAARAQKFCESLELFSLLANVADAKSLVIHPASTTHAQLGAAQLAACGITGSTVRLSIGLEHIDDLLQDLEQALNKSLENESQP